MKSTEIATIMKGMAETDVSHEFGWEPGYSSLVLGPEHSQMLHRGGVCHTGVEWGHI